MHVVAGFSAKSLLVCLISNEAANAGTTHQRTLKMWQWHVDLFYLIWLTRKPAHFKWEHPWSGSGYCVHISNEM